MFEIHEEEATNQVNGSPGNLLILCHTLLLEPCLIFTEDQTSFSLDQSMLQLG